MNSILQTIIVAFMLLIAAETSRAQTDEEAIRACFKKYQEAIAKKDGAAAAKLVSRNTIVYFSRILNDALNAEEAKVRKLPFYDKTMVLLIRQELPDTYITNGVSTNAMQFFALLVERGWGGQVGAEKLELGKITMETNKRASATGVLNGQETPATFVFDRSADGWKFSLLDVILRVNTLMAEKQKNTVVSEDEAILTSLEARTGRPIKKDIWKPMTKSSSAVPKG